MPYVISADTVEKKKHNSKQYIYTTSPTEFKYQTSKLGLVFSGPTPNTQ